MMEKEERRKLIHMECLLCARHFPYITARNPTKTMHFYRGCNWGSERWRKASKVTELMWQTDCTNGTKSLYSPRVISFWYSLLTPTLEYAPWHALTSGILANCEQRLAKCLWSGFALSWLVGTLPPWCEQAWATLLDDKRDVSRGGPYHPTPASLHPTHRCTSKPS